MSDATQLEAHLRDHSEDWDSWLVYADWLLERGDVRGNLIAFERQLALRELSPEHRRDLEQQREMLLAAHTLTWLPRELSTIGATYQWRFGFIVSIRLPWNHHTLRRLSQVQAHRSARFLTTLDLAERSLGADGASALAQSPQSEALRSIRTLRLGWNLIGDKGTLALTQCDALRDLAHLDLHGNDIGPQGARTLASPDVFRSLSTLDLSYNAIRKEGALSLSERLRSLRTLDLRNNGIGEAGTALVASGRPLGCTVLV